MKSCKNNMLDTLLRRCYKKYDELNGMVQSQLLFGIGQDRENKYIHILRKRYGNAAEVQLELTKEAKDETIAKRLWKVSEELVGIQFLSA